VNAEITSPADCMRAVIDDLNLRRRGQIQERAIRGEDAVIRALVPLMNMFGYGNDLSSMTQGRGAFAMRFDHYAPAPPQYVDPPPFPPAMGMRA